MSLERSSIQEFMQKQRQLLQQQQQQQQQQQEQAQPTAPPPTDFLSVSGVGAVPVVGASPVGEPSVANGFVAAAPTPAALGGVSDASDLSVAVAMPMAPAPVSAAHVPVSSHGAPAVPAAVLPASAVPVRPSLSSPTVAELQAELALERKQHQQTKITLQAYAAELSDLIEQQQDAATCSSEADQALEAHSVTLQTEVARLTGDVELLEHAFSQLKQRYDLSQEQIKTLTQSEERLTVELRDAVEQLNQANTKFRLLRVQAQHKLSAASEQIDHLTSTASDEIALLRAKLIKAESALSAKNAELHNLQNLCDELIGKLEGHSGRASESSERHLDTWLLDEEVDENPGANDDEL
jgi:hypothetical protein